MDNQEFYNISSEHLLNQMAVSESEDGCLYRGPKGRMCPVGACIPDEKYLPVMEGKGVEGLIKFNKEIKAIFHGVELGLLIRMQSIHDNLLPEHWADMMKCVAIEFGLKSTNKKPG